MIYLKEEEKFCAVRKVAEKFYWTSLGIFCCLSTLSIQWTPPLYKKINLFKFNLLKPNPFKSRRSRICEKFHFLWLNQGKKILMKKIYVKNFFHHFTQFHFNFISCRLTPKVTIFLQDRFLLTKWEKMRYFWVNHERQE